MEIQGKTANEVWCEAFRALHNADLFEEQMSRNGQTRELMHVLFHIDNPKERWVYSRSPGINPAFAIAEIIWIVSGRRDAAFLNHWNSQLPEYAGTGDFYHGAYGHRLRNSFEFDQLEAAYSALKMNPNSRQVVLQIWEPQSDFPLDGRPKTRDIPCNTQSYLKVRNNKLVWTQMMRSNDLILGLPYNIIQFTCLQEIMAGWLGIEVGSYHHLSDSLHLYESNRSTFKSRDVSSHQNNDHLALPFAESERIFEYLVRFVDQMVYDDCDEKTLSRIVAQTNLPQAYQNWVYLLGAEEARRQKWSEIQANLVDKLTNPALIAVWQHWNERFKSIME